MTLRISPHAIEQDQGPFIFPGILVGSGPDLPSVPDGTLHVWAGSAGAVTAAAAADDLVVENDGAGGISILVPDVTWANIYFGQGAVNNDGFIRYGGVTHQLEFGVDQATIAMWLPGQVSFIGNPFTIYCAGVMALEATTEIVVNDRGFDVDFRVEAVGVANALFVQGSDGKVGMGIGTPDGTLHVHTATAGVVTASIFADDLVLESGGVTGMSLLFPNSQAGVIMFGDVADNYYHSIEGFGSAHATVAGSVLHYVANTYMMRLTSTGVTIGPGADGVAPSELLHVIGAAGARIAIDAGASSDAVLEMGQDVTAGPTWGLGLDASAADAFVIAYAAGGNPSLTGGNLFTILTGGNVGIGTAAPQLKFVVSNAGAQGFEVNPNSGLIAGGIDFLSYNRTTVAYAPLVIDASVIVFHGSSTGNVGIGVLAPVGLLDISGTVGVDAVGIALYDGAVTKAWFALAPYGMGGMANNDLIIRSDGDRIGFGFAGAEKVTFKSNGRVGINTTIPTDRLTVKASGGSIGITLLNASDVSIMRLWQAGPGYGYLDIDDQAGTNRVRMNTGGASWISGKVGIGVIVSGSIAAKLHVDQASTSGAIPVLVLDQADISEGFINFIGSDRGVIAGATNSVRSVRAEFGGTVYRLALYANA